MFLGFNLTFFPQFILGYLGMPRRYHAYPPEFQVLNVLSSAGASILAVAYLMPLFYLTWSLFRGAGAPANPWGSARASNGRRRRRRPASNFVGDADRDRGPPYAYPTSERGARCLTTIAPHADFQFSDARHQAETAIAGMWLFLATEVLFFGGLILAWMFCRHWQPAGFDAGARETVIVHSARSTSSCCSQQPVYSSGLAWIEARRPRGAWCSAAGSPLASASLFLVLKFFEWYIDIAEHLFPAGAFKLTGAEADGARMFWSFYFVATGLHAVHMIVGVGLLSLARVARAQGRLQPHSGTRRSRSSASTGASSISSGSCSIR